MAKYRKVRIPSPGELWRRLTAYYIITKDGKFQKLHFEPHCSSSPCLLRQSILAVNITGDVHDMGRRICDGYEEWVFVADNWVSHAQEKYRSQVETYRTVLKECEKAINEIR